MVLVLDNRDSFVHNLARYVRELGGEAVVWRSDEEPSPTWSVWPEPHHRLAGPCTPREAGISTDVVRKFGRRRRSSASASATSASAPPTAVASSTRRRPMHGKTSRIVHDGTSVFAGLPSPLRVARYHSLVIAPRLAAGLLRVTATPRTTARSWRSEHRAHPVVGVQFHPESAATEYGYAIVDRFLTGERSSGLDAAAARRRCARPAGRAGLGHARGRARGVRAAAGGAGALMIAGVDRHDRRAAGSRRTSRRWASNGATR